MVWTRIDPSDGKPRFLRKQGQNVILTREKWGTLLDEIPDGWRIIERNGHLKLVRV